jgi:hypothetical protein
MKIGKGDDAGSAFTLNENIRAVKQQTTYKEAEERTDNFRDDSSPLSEYPGSDIDEDMLPLHGGSRCTQESYPQYQVPRQGIPPDDARGAEIPKNDLKKSKAEQQRNEEDERPVLK